LTTLLQLRIGHPVDDDAIARTMMSQRRHHRTDADILKRLVLSKGRVQYTARNACKEKLSERKNIVN